MKNKELNDIKNFLGRLNHFLCHKLKIYYTKTNIFTKFCP